METERIALRQRERDRLKVLHEGFFAAARLSDITDARIEDYKTARLREGTGPVGVNRDLALLLRVSESLSENHFC
jgi:hypothetical protein